MCNFASPPVKYKGKTFTGYKIVLKVGGRYYSPSTGVEYKEGKKVPTPKISVDDVYRGSMWAAICDIVQPYGIFFKELMVGRTAVFDSLDDAISRRKGRYESVVKMTISGSLIEGGFQSHTIIAGKKIEKIEEIGCDSLEEPVLKI